MNYGFKLCTLVSAICCSSIASAKNCGASPRSGAEEYGNAPGRQISSTPFGASETLIFPTPSGAALQTLPINSFPFSGGSCGNPNSVQAQALNTAFDIQSIDEEGSARFEMPDSDLVGLAMSRWVTGGHDGERLDISWQHSSRIAEGSRARLLINLPLSVIRTDPVAYYLSPPRQFVRVALEKQLTVQGSISAAVEFPVTKSWTLTPRATVGFSDEERPSRVTTIELVSAPPPTRNSGDPSNAELATLSLMSRYSTRVGRGDLVLGNMIAYSTTVKIGLVNVPYYQRSGGFAFTNGLAYQLPLKQRLFGHQTSMRISYAFTHLDCERAPYKDYHQAALNFGVRIREQSAKAGMDMLRIGLSYLHANNLYNRDADHDALSLNLGYRF
ncbi:MAG: hypothetical protein ABW039_13930 [Sphingobium sp.]